MASNTLSGKDASAASATFTVDQPQADSLGDLIRTVLSPLASLKLTVALFGMAIFLVLAGTVAQVDQDIWDVMKHYFRTPVAWIELRIFFPRAWDVPGGFPFPGGWLIGGLMAVNLIAAHTVRFKAQAQGTRLWAGVGVLLLGLLCTWLVVVSGDNKEGIQGQPLVSWEMLWKLILAGLAVTSVGGIAAACYAPHKYNALRWLVGSLAAFLGLGVCWLIYQGESAALSGPSLRILWQLIKGLAAGIVLGIGCWMVFRRRAGVVLLHGGIFLMMLSELLVGLTAVEGQMHIKEGQTVNYVQDIRTLELAVIDPTQPDTDQVVAVPWSLLPEGKKFADPLLPFQVEVVKFLQNSDIRQLQPQDQGANLATAGQGLKWIVEPVRATAGTDAGGDVDLSSAYVKVTPPEGGPAIGTYLLSLAMALQDVPERITVGEKTYDVFLRFKRSYKPYSMHLVDVRFDKYMGTNTPRNYSSELRLVDPTRNVDREVKIWMNNPLRFAGETFYQSSFNVDPSSSSEITGLQVVTNEGWMLPYVGCMIVASGLLVHFSLTLVRFLRRQLGLDSSAELAGAAANSRAASVAAQTVDVPQTSAAAARGHAPAGASRRAAKAEKALGQTNAGRAAWIVPLVVVAVLGGWLLSKSRAPAAKPGEMDFYAFGQIPLVYQGRIKPFDTLARNSLRVVSDRETYVDAQGKSQPAVRWLLDLMSNPGKAAEHQVVRIQNLEVLDLLKLERRPGYRYAVQEFRDHMEPFEKQVAQARAVREKNTEQLSVYQKKVLELDQRLRVLMTLLTAFDRPEIRDESAAQDLMAALQRQQMMLPNMEPPLAVPPQDPNGDWEAFASAWTKAWAQVNVLNQPANPSTLRLDGILVAYAKGDVAGFNNKVADYRQSLAAVPPVNYVPAKSQFEAQFNQMQPFYHASVLYVFAFLLVAVSWLFWHIPFNRAAFWLIVLTLIVHTAALCGRMYISGRPPVTNLYSSAIFIGWGCVIFGLVLEWIFRLGIGNVVAAVSGFSTLLIAHFLAGDGDTLAVLQAVLDTQFWLATHVTCITLGYATTYVAGLLGLIYLVFGFVHGIGRTLIGQPGGSASGTGQSAEMAFSVLAKMIYGVLCFAIFFSFVGTVLGGLWADDSWGRFWGWDPKENGALIIVLWNALVLHARWDGMVKGRGLAALAVGGNIVTSWSWFGVNELGAGLHSYGFTEGVALALLIFIGSQLLLISAAALTPARIWQPRRVPVAAPSAGAVS